MPKLVLPYVLRAPDRPFAGTIPPGTPRTPRKVHDTPVPHPLMTVESASKNTGTTRRDRLAGKVRATPGRCPLPMPGEGAQHPVPPGLKDLQLLGLRLVTAGVWCGVPVSLAARSGRGEDHRPRLHRHPGGSAQPRLGSVSVGADPAPRARGRLSPSWSDVSEITPDATREVARREPPTGGVVGTGGATVRPLHRLPARACGPCHSREYMARAFSFAVDDATGSGAPGVQDP